MNKKDERTLCDILQTTKIILDDLGICNVFIDRHEEVFLDVNRLIRNNKDVTENDFNKKLKAIFLNDLQLSKPNFLHSGYSKSDETSGKIFKVLKLENENVNSLYNEGTNCNRRFGFASRSDIMYLIFGEELMKETQRLSRYKEWKVDSFEFEYIDYKKEKVVKNNFCVPYYIKNNKKHPIVFLPTKYCTPGDVGHKQKKKFR